MDYFFAPPAQPYPFYGIKPYSPQEEPQTNTLDAFGDPAAYQYFDQTAQYNATPIISLPQTPPHTQPLHRPSIATTLPYDSSGSGTNDIQPDPELDQAQGRSSDDDKDNLTPAQSRRKAQNRAAQRAFRERKERHVKELELKLKSMEAQSTNLMTDNERLKRELDRVATQNEILRATSTPMKAQSRNRSKSNDTDSAQHDPEALTAGPMVYSPSSFNAAFSEHHTTGPDEPISHRVKYSSTTGERLLATGAAWDLIQSHDLYMKGVVDLGEVCDRLREKVLCDGAGPSFAENEVIRAIEDSVGAAGDELI